MLVTNHVLAGAVLGAGPLAERPVQAFATGVVSHFVLDQVPHWGDQRRGVFLVTAVCDGLAGLAAIALVARASRRQRPAVLLSALAGMAGGAFPDLDKPSDLFFGRSPFPARIDAFHARIQRESTRRMPQEVLVAAGLSAVVALLLRGARKS
ncbi:hypothetical protein SAMN06264364_13418 [Quadrisphaera granulorum]|uniref:Uncharacterized protein n=1 Tax=Quadrisphaera granulorum TaxID=317664 RepID=A0A315ZQI2_9ACTN|nr:hypothetical protein [Quadrisphaera granulorum]PWJ47845.1 hypothetical protein BXY45_13418 [Quadrisphaera granulorum]SZE98612.1 hypothetical protein SAMN06264364_13418 [Quadrisphaera granulorum]